MPGAASTALTAWRRRRDASGAERGAVLVEFALASLVLYLLVAGAVDFGRMLFDANVLQDAARVAARELALAPARAEATLDYALTCDADADADCLADLRTRVFDPACLVVDLADPAVSADIEGYFAAMPIVNRALRPLMITDPMRPTLLRYAGALVVDGSGAACRAAGPNGQASATGLTVGIPLVEGRDPNGAELISWVPVLQELRATADAECPARGPFSLLYLAAADDCGALEADPLPDRGLAAIRLNYPFQAAMLTGFRSPPATFEDPVPRNLSGAITADDGGVQSINEAPGALVDEGGVGPYAGAYGLGRQLALAGRVVRPFRRVLSAQAIYRREAVE